MSMQVNELLGKNDGGLTLLRDRLLAELVCREGDKKELLKTFLSGLNASASFAFPTLAVIEPSGFAGHERQRRRYAERIRDYLQRLAADGNVVFTDEEGRIGLLFSWVSKEEVEEMRAALGAEFSHPISIGVGLPCGKLSHAHLSYRQALFALGDIFYKGVGRVVYYSELGSHARLSEYPIARERELYLKLRSSENAEGIRAGVDEFYDRLLEDGALDRQQVDEATIRLLIGMEKRMLAESAESEELSATAGYQGHDILSIVKMETLAEVKGYVCEQLEGLLSRVPSGEQENQRLIIKQTIEYMELEFECATLYSTARQVYMTPTYLSSLFKLNTGKTFIEQLTDIRMEKAKSMLRSTHLKNYEVAEKVGYKDSRYFSQIFKKKVGQSPSEYRESAARS